MGIGRKADVEDEVEITEWELILGNHMTSGTAVQFYGFEVEITE